MKLASVARAVISSLAPGVFAQNALPEPSASVRVVDYHYGMEVNVQKVLQRTDTSRKTGVVPVTLVYEDSEGELHKIRFLEWGGSTTSAVQLRIL
jgi:hypothetical protein